MLCCASIYFFIVNFARSSMATNSVHVSPHAVNYHHSIPPVQEDGLGAVLKEIKNAKKTITDILEKDLGQSKDSKRLVYYLHALRIFQAEFSTHLNAWNEITQIIEVPNIQRTRFIYLLSCRRWFNRVLRQSVLMRSSPIYLFVQKSLLLTLVFWRWE